MPQKIQRKESSDQPIVIFSRHENKNKGLCADCIFLEENNSIKHPLFVWWILASQLHRLIDRYCESNEARLRHNR